MEPLSQSLKITSTSGKAAHLKQPYLQILVDLFKVIRKYLDMPAPGLHDEILIPHKNCAPNRENYS
jgi:hypothetical protein